MKNLLIAVCLLLLPSLTYAQDSVQVLSKNTFFQFDLGIGYTDTQLGSINETLSNYGLETFTEGLTTLSLSSTVFLNRTLIKNELTWLVSQDVDQAGDLTTQFGGNAIGISLGYAIVQKPSFRITPYLGLNAYTGKLSFIDNAPVQRVDDVFDNTFRNADIYFSNAAFDVGIQVERLIKLKNRKWDCPQNARFMTVGIRGGYNVGFGETEAKYNGNQGIEGGPTNSLEGFYVKAIIGVGTKIRNIKWRK